jgi:NADPH2:quinone reductase
MKAAFINRTGPPDVISYGDMPDPNAGPGECLIRVCAVDVNPIDTYIRSGAISANVSFPYIIGRDLAGTVVDVGTGVKKIKKGQRVWVTGQGVAHRQGTFSELSVAAEEWIHHTPEGVSDEDIVAISLVGITAYLGLVPHSKLQPGEVLFVNGGTGGVGSSVVQMAKAIGAKVITTAGSAEKVKAAREFGADVALNYKTEDVDAAIRKFAPNGVNVWWETLREPSFERTIPLLAMRGRMVVMAGRDAKPVFPVGPFYVKDCSLHGFAMFNATANEQAEAAEAINGWMRKGKLKAQIDRVMPLSQAAEAHRLQEESTIHRKGTLAGKIVLRV